MDLHIGPALGNCSHSGRGPWRPATSGVSGGLWVPLEAVQSLRKAWAALRCARRWVIENPALPSSWDKITRTCLEKRADEDQWETRAYGRGKKQQVPTCAGVVHCPGCAGCHVWIPH